MSACTFFGHKDTPPETEQPLRVALLKLIEDQKVDRFFVGNNGQFDAIVRKVLIELKDSCCEIDYSVVLSYYPTQKANDNYSDAILPDGIESVPKRFAISWRNRWMIERSDYVIVYVTHSWGGAAQFMALAQKQGKTVIQLAK